VFAYLQRLPFSLDPLIAEAKRRAWQRRVLVALVVSAVVAGGVVLGFELRGLGSVAPVPANLTVLAVAEDSGALGPKGGRALFHLRCDPAGGNVAQPAQACAAIAAQPSLVTNPKPFYDFGPNTVYFTITGRLNGRPVHYSGESSWTPQMALIHKLGLAGPHGQPLRLEARRHGSVALNQIRTALAVGTPKGAVPMDAGCGADTDLTAPHRRTRQHRSMSVLSRIATDSIERAPFMT